MRLKHFFNSLAAIAAFAAVMVSCEDKPLEEKTNTLSVEPSSAIEFLASGNEDVTLRVTTDADSWDFTAPDWIEATKGANTLLVNAKDNATSEELIGRIVFTAGNAERVTVNVTQQAAGNVPPSGDSVNGVFANAGTESTLYFSTETSLTASVNLTIASAVDADVVVSVSVDAGYLAEYNYNNGESFELFPETQVAIDGRLTVPAGETVSNTLDITLDVASGLEYGTGYLVPLVVTAESSNVSIARNDSRVNLVVMKQNPKEIKNVLYFEVNDTNPLNALEYVLEDGTPFFDAVILFAANINYDSRNDVVYLHNNANVQALLDESDVYIQPLRKAGIKVYLGLLGNHDAAGLCQLSDWGAAEWAKEVARACRDYGLDGVNLDDEYSSSPDLSNPWFTSRSSAAGSRLCYELKKAMAAECSWPTEVSYFAYGSLYNVSSVTDQETGDVHTPAEFIDFYVANYGSATRPYSDLTYKNCSCCSIECNLGSGRYNMTESNARSWKESGYGWCMWFAFDPSGTGSIYNNLNSNWSYMQAAARGFYDQELLEPTGVYNKISEGKYDPVRYER